MSRKHRTRKRGSQEHRRPKRVQRRHIPRNGREAQILEKVLAALSLSRRETLSLRTAAKIEGTRESTIRRYAPSAIEIRKGVYRVKPFDSLPRPLTIVGSKGMQPLVVRSSR